MVFRILSHKKLALRLAGFVVVCLLLSWLALPRIIQAQAEKFIAEKTGHHLTMERPEFNPFKLSLRLSGLHLTQPGGEPLLVFRELTVNLSTASLFRGALIFDSIRLDGLEATAIFLSNGQLNWSGLLDALQRKESAQPQAPDSALPRFVIHQLVVTDAAVNFTDHQVSPAFVTRVAPINLELEEISSLADDKGQHKFSARTSFGAQLSWQGSTRLTPLAATGRFSVEDVNLAALSAYVKDELPVTVSAGIAGLSANYQIGYANGKPELNLEHVSARLTGLQLQQNQDSGPVVVVDAIEAKEGRYNLAKNSFELGALGITGGKLHLQHGKDDAPEALELGSLALQDVHVNMASHHASVGIIAVKEGYLRATRDARGHIDIVDVLNSASSPAKPKQKAKVPAATAPEKNDWHYRVEKLELSGFNAAFRDQTVKPAAELGLQDIALSLAGISEDWKIAVPLQASFKTPSGGSFAAEGSVVPALPSADIHLKLTELSLTPAQPYLAAVAKLKLLKGNLSTEGRASYNAQGASYKGNFALNDLRLNEADTGNLFLVWKSLSSRSFEVSPTKLNVDELVINGLDTKLIINKDKSVSFKRLLLQPEAGATPPATPVVAVETPARAFAINIDRLRFLRGEMDFADYSLALPFGTRIHDLQGIVSGLSSRPGAAGQLQLDGQVDDYGIARAAGQIDLFNPTELMDLKVVFRNIEMSRLTPYSATFAGRKINSGKLSLDLEYKIHQRQLQGNNQIIMNQLVLGDRVDSPEAKDLPLDLAISILQDSDGRIDLGLPISGSLDDPQFSYGGIVWKAIVSVFTKIATAPFRALGALFGGDDKFEKIAFDAGDAQLIPPEREKLVRLAEALTKRPNLSIAVHGVYADADRVALQDRQLRRDIAKESGQHLEGDDDPGPLSLRQPKIQSSIEDMFSDQFGGGELSAFQEGFRQANPGQLEQSTTSKVMSSLTGVFHKKRVLTEQEIAHLKGADFYAVLFERLRGAEVVENERLLALAVARGESTAAALKAAGAPMERITVLAAEKVEASGRDVPVKLVLGTSAKSTAPTRAVTQ
jgi:hypothetical protein